MFLNITKFEHFHALAIIINAFSTSYKSSIENNFKHLRNCMYIYMV